MNRACGAFEYQKPTTSPLTSPSTSIGTNGDIADRQRLMFTAQLGDLDVGFREVHCEDLLVNREPDESYSQGVNT